MSIITRYQWYYEQINTLIILKEHGQHNLKKNAPIIEDISDISQNHTSSRSSGLLISAATPVKNKCLTTPNLRKRVPKQMLKILLILLTQLQAGSTYDNHLWQVVYSLYKEK